MLANPLVDDPRVVHLKFTEIVADPIASVHKVYNRASLPLRAEHESSMRIWLKDPANKVDRYGRYPYRHEPFGITQAWVRELFSDYSKRFGLA